MILELKILFEHLSNHGFIEISNSNLQLLPISYTPKYFQDLCELVNASQPYWLNGIVEITRTFCLQLIETAITDFSHVFLNVCSF